LCPVWQDR